LRNNDRSEYENEIDLRKVFIPIWTGRRLFFGLSAFFAFITVVYAFSLPNVYRSVVVLAPATQATGGLSKVFSEISGIASIAGMKLGTEAVTDAQLAEEIMKSWGFIEAFISDNNLEVEIYASSGWDRENNVLKIDPSLYDVVNKKWLIEAEDGTREPNSWELFDTFSQKLQISQQATTGLLSVSIGSYAPLYSKKWVDLYFSAINRHMQLRKLRMIDSNIEYLQAQIHKSSITGMHEVFYTIIEEQLKSKMIAEATPEHTFVQVSPSMIPMEESSPKRFLICLLGTLLGIILSSFFVLIKHYQNSIRSLK